MNFIIKKNSLGFYIIDATNPQKYLLNNGRVYGNVGWDIVDTELFYFKTNKAAQDVLDKFYFQAKYVQLKNGERLLFREEAVYIVDGEYKTLADINSLLNGEAFKATIEKKIIFTEV